MDGEMVSAAADPRPAGGLATEIQGSPEPPVVSDNIGYVNLGENVTTPRKTFRINSLQVLSSVLQCSRRGEASIEGC